MVAVIPNYDEFLKHKKELARRRFYCWNLARDIIISNLPIRHRKNKRLIRYFVRSVIGKDSKKLENKLFNHSIPALALMRAWEYNGGDFESILDLGQIT